VLPGGNATTGELVVAVIARTAVSLIRHMMKASNGRTFSFMVSYLPFRSAMLMQIVHFHQSNSGGVVYASHDCGVVARWEVCNDRRLPSVRRRIAAVPN